MNWKFLPLVMILFLMGACTPTPREKPFSKEKVKAEVIQMLDAYHSAIGEKGLTAEFDYLDHSVDFFWVPPGYTQALNYDSVKTILLQNAKTLRKAEFAWETLEVFPLTNEIANYTGIVNGAMTDTAGISSKVSIIESGTLIKRKDGWKLLSGQSAVLAPAKGAAQ